MGNPFSEYEIIKRQQFITLSWRLLEHAVAYYEPEIVHPSNRKWAVISDELYDAMEKDYIRLGEELQEPCDKHKYMDSYRRNGSINLVRKRLRMVI